MTAAKHPADRPRVFSIDIRPDPQLAQQSTSLVHQAGRHTTITTRVHLAAAQAFWAGVGDLIAKIEAKYKKLKAPILLAARTNDEDKKEQLAPLQRIHRTVGDAITAAQARFDEETRKARQKEAEKQARARQQAEAEALRRQAEEASSKRAEQRLVAQAEAVERRPLEVGPISNGPSTAQSADTYTRKEWRAEIVDPDELWAAIRAGKLAAEQTPITMIAGFAAGYFNTEAERLHEAMSEVYPGVFACEKSILARKPGERQS